MQCYCQSQKSFHECCEPLLKGERKARTAEELMRSRYTAYATAQIDYIQKTLAPESQKNFDRASSLKWAQESEWLGLEILKTQKGEESDSKGTVEFLCRYKTEGETLEHHEVSEFKKNKNGDWVFVDGHSHTHKEGEGHQHHHPKVETLVREEPKIGRNDPCPCGSGKKYKKCCGT